MTCRQSGPAASPITRIAIAAMLLFLAAGAAGQETGTLTGGIVDAADGVTPVHPVYISMLDSATGTDISGLGATNNPDGSYTIENIPVGSYKIFFDAYDTAAAFADELYDDFSCANGSCGLASSGTVLEIGAGVHEIDVDLVRRLSISGRISNESDEPLPGVAIDVVDEFGALVGGGAAWSNENGLWIIGLPGPGTYYAKTIGEWAPGYQAEAWENIPCDDCDAVAEGTPIVVDAADVAGIDFQLDPLFAISGRVTSDQGTPFEDVPVEILDGSGMPIERGAAFTDANGEWLMVLPGPGTYYARTVGTWTPGYQPEFWNDRECEDCYSDPSSLGDPIEVAHGRVTGVDFALAARPLAKPLSRCEQVRRQFRAYHLAGPDDRKFQAVTNRWIPASFITDLKAVNVNWVSIMQMMYVDDALDSTLEFEPKGQDLYNVNWSFTEKDLEFLIKTFQAHGINVYVTLAISPSLAMASEHPFHRHEMGAQSHSLGPDESWPWNGDHPDHERFVEEFWQTYRDRAVELAEILQRYGVSMYSIGTETRNLFRTREAPDEGYPNSFRAELQRIVDDVRAVYSGLLTYDMHWGEFAYPNPAWASLWDDLGLDIIGVSAYIDNVLPQIPTQVPDVPTLQASLDSIFRTQFLPVQQANSGRPILFLEGSFSNSIGAPYLSHHNLGQTDTDEDGNGVNDGQETQANLFQALFNVMNRYRANVKGVFIWDRFMVSDEDWQVMIANDPIILGTRGLLSDEVVGQVYGAWKAEEESRIFDSSFERCVLDGAD